MSEWDDIDRAAAFCIMVETSTKGSKAFAPGCTGKFTADAKWYAARHPELYERFIAERVVKRLTTGEKK